MTKTSTQLPPAAIVIFGITGDLAQRKLLPALYHLIKNDILHPQTVIVGITRRAVSVDELLNETNMCGDEPGGVCDPAAFKRMRGMLKMCQMDLLDGAAYDALRESLQGFDAAAGAPLQRLFYLSIPPNVFEPIVALLGQHGLNASGARLLVEKPFGYDLESARELIAQTSRHFGEEQLFRIDHYLAKETVQNILTFRFHNPIFEPLWNAAHVSRIEVEATEQIGIEGRAVFYEQTGALRDFVQSHLLQLLAAVTMERPKEMTAPAIHAARLELLNAIAPITAPQVAARAIRGQYKAYRTEVDDTKTAIETFAALRLDIQNDRWRGVPVIIKTGKALAKKQTLIRVSFVGADGVSSNTLVFAIQPREGIEVDLQVKRPGFDRALETAVMDFRYERHFDDHGHPDAYERVLVDAVRGDRTLFATSDEVLASWRILNDVIAVWSENDNALNFYESGSDGPTLPPKFTR